jgi:hypothetical protein
MMHGQEKSDSCIVAMKPTNKPAMAGAEPVEPRGKANDIVVGFDKACGAKHPRSEPGA